MTHEQRELLTRIHYILEMNVNSNKESYEHSVQENHFNKIFQVDREQHLEEIMKWTMQQLENNFELLKESKS